MLFSDAGACKIARSRQRVFNHNAKKTTAAHQLAPGGSAGIAGVRIFAASEYPLPALFLL
jgi:hypothetical protein